MPRSAAVSAALISTGSTAEGIDRIPKARKPRIQIAATSFSILAAISTPAQINRITLAFFISDASQTAHNDPSTMLALTCSLPAALTAFFDPNPPTPSRTPFLTLAATNTSPRTAHTVSASSRTKTSISRPSIPARACPARLCESRKCLQIGTIRPRYHRHGEGWMIRTLSTVSLSWSPVLHLRKLCADDLETL